eukprot:CAMPEP_0119308062 /NCGR_PEP_ID=MMETSP1333-20130426/8384_1 /TAXON_ID=418940 /ORGANISM="Scyphosphaera apsteinii, Strain RCC1455" /LENGTH=187 /DNA_ID=CAMNT_0007311753 /DNA_START=215 /DNA_END=779 /DNA_ORIENTATION=-
MELRAWYCPHNAIDRLRKLQHVMPADTHSLLPKHRPSPLAAAAVSPCAASAAITITGVVITVNGFTAAITTNTCSIVTRSAEHFVHPYLVSAVFAAARRAAGMRAYCSEQLSQAPMAAASAPNGRCKRRASRLSAAYQHEEHVPNPAGVQCGNGERYRDNIAQEVRREKYRDDNSSQTDIGERQQYV